MWSFKVFFIMCRYLDRFFFLSSELAHQRRLIVSNHGWLIILWIVLLTSHHVATAAPAPIRDQGTIIIPLGKARIIELTAPAARVSIANPAVADLLLIHPQQLYVTGKELGTTNLVLWSDNDQVQLMRTLEVTHDLETLQEKLFRLLPREPIQVTSAQGAIVLSGTVSSAPKLAAAVRIAEQYAANRELAARIGLPASGQPNVINLLQVAGAQQVLLEVKVAEINRTLTRKMDINFTGMDRDGNLRLGAVNGGATFPDYLVGEDRIPIFSPRGGALGGPAVSEFNPSDAAIANSGAFLNLLSGNLFFNAVLDMAKSEGLARILAEPNLTTLSGQPAEFLSGGEYPIPRESEDGNTSIEFKTYGIELKFIPVVLDSGLINLTINVSVSSLDYSSAASLALPTMTSSDLIVPGLKKRAANATVEVPTGQTLAIAGLLNETLTESASRFPGLGNLPLIGPLFRSQDFQKGQTELMIFVTPRLAQPFNTELVKLPTDRFLEPSATEFYLMGRLEGRPGQEAVHQLGPDKSGTEGWFGHDL
jgi:pilus assembly protein CpaC